MTHGEKVAKTGKPKQRAVTLYYVTDPGKPVKCPPEGDTLFASMAADFEIHATSGGAASHSQSLLDMDREIERKFPRVQQESESDPEPSEPLPIQQQTYFDSPEAKKFFIGNSRSKFQK